MTNKWDKWKNDVLEISRRYQKIKQREAEAKKPKPKNPDSLKTVAKEVARRYQKIKQRKAEALKQAAQTERIMEIARIYQQIKREKARIYQQIKREKANRQAPKLKIVKNSD